MRNALIAILDRKALHEIMSHKECPKCQTEIGYSESTYTDGRCFSCETDLIDKRKRVRAILDGANAGTLNWKKAEPIEYDGVFFEEMAIGDTLED